jgi:hypothetical protein
VAYVSPVSGADPTRFVPSVDSHDPTDSSSSTNSSNGTTNSSGTSSHQSAASPEQATDAAVKKVEAAQIAVNHAQAAANNPKGTPASISHAQISLPSLQKSLTDAQTQLKTAIDNEITAKVGLQGTSDQVAQAGHQIAARFSSDRTAQKLVDQAVAGISTARQLHSIVASAQAQSDPVKSVQSLNNSYVHGSQTVKDAMLNDPGVHQILQRAAQWATQPLSPQINAGVGFQAPGLQAMQRLAQLTHGTDANLGAQLVSDALPHIEQVNKSFQAQYDQSMLGPEGVQAMLKVVDNISGTAIANADVQRLAAQHFWNSSGMTNAIASGATPTYAIALAQQPGIDRQMVLQAALTGVSEYQQKVDGDVANYAKQTQELNWLINNAGTSMTPAQLSQAVSDYVKSKGGAWQSQYAQDTQQLASDGQTLLRQMKALQTLPPSLAGYQSQADSTINRVINDPQANAAISMALQKTPDLTSGDNAKSTLDFFATVKLSDGGRKLAQEAATAYVKSKILPDIAQLNSKSDPAAFARLQADLKDLRDSNFSKVLGVAPKDFNKAIDYLEQALPTAGEDAAAIEAKLAKLDENLSNLSSGPKAIKAFDKATFAGQLVRGLGLAAAGASFINDFNKATNDPSTKNILKTFVDVAGISQKSSELALGLGAVDEGSLLGQFGGAAKLGARWGAGEFIAGVGALFDAWSAVDAANKGDNVSAGLYAAGALGGLATAIGAGSWLGPVGIGIAIASAIGLAVWNHHKEVTQFETPTTSKFLESSGFTPQAAQALTQESGDGHSAVPLLARYAQLHGLNLQKAADQKKFVGWINSLTPDQLHAVVSAANSEQDRIHGDVSQFKTTSGQDNVPFVTHMATRFGPVTRPNIHTESATLMDRLLQSLHAPQLH